MDEEEDMEEGKKNNKTLEVNGKIGGGGRGEG